MCIQCQHEKEFFIESADDTHQECPICGGPMDRIISAPKVVMAGGTEGQALKAIQAIQKKDGMRKLYF